MATETGTIQELFSETSGSINRDGDPRPNPVKFDDPTIKSRGVVLNVNDAVIYDITPETWVISNVSLATPANPDYPSNDQFPGATIVNTPQTEDLTINGTTTIIDGTTVTGKIHVTNGGTLVVKSPNPDSPQQGVVNGSIVAESNSTVILYNSVVENNVKGDTAAAFRTIKSTVKGNVELDKTGTIVITGTTVKGNVELQKGGSIVVIGTTVKGNVELQKADTASVTSTEVKGDFALRGTAVSATVTNLTSTDGNVEIHNNTGCSYTNVTAPKGKVKITECKAG